MTANNDIETKRRPLLFTNYTHLSSWLVKSTMIAVYNVGAKPTGRMLVYESVSKEWIKNEYQFQPVRNLWGIWRCVYLSTMSKDINGYPSCQIILNKCVRRGGRKGSDSWKTWFHRWWKWSKFGRNNELPRLHNGEEEKRWNAVKRKIDDVLTNKEITSRQQPSHLGKMPRR